MTVHVSDTYAWCALGMLLILRVLDERRYFSTPLTVSDTAIGCALWPLTLVLLVVDWAMWRKS